MALGLMFSAVLKSQQVAMQIAFVATMLPSLILSGFIFPIANMPLPLRILSYGVPARYFIGIARGLFLKGVGIETLWPQLLAMVAFAFVLVALATSRFKRTLA
jgi:ABC-2 type transport system permease protein